MAALDTWQLSWHIYWEAWWMQYAPNFLPWRVLSSDSPGPKRVAGNRVLRPTTARRRVDLSAAAWTRVGAATYRRPGAARSTPCIPLRSHPTSYGRRRTALSSPITMGRTGKRGSAYTNGVDDSGTYRTKKISPCYSCYNRLFSGLYGIVELFNGTHRIFSYSF